MEKRKNRASDFSSISKALQIPMKLSKDAPNVKPIELRRVERKTVIKPGNKSREPEYCISDSDYENILNIIQMELHFLLDEKKFDNQTPANNKESFNIIAFPDNKNSINPVLDKNNSLLKIYEDIFFSNNEPIALNNTNEYSEEKNKIEKQDEIKGDEKKI